MNAAPTGALSEVPDSTPVFSDPPSANWSRVLAMLAGVVPNNIAQWASRSRPWTDW